MEQIKRANRMYTNDSIFLKKSLSIPVLSDSDLAHCRPEPEDNARAPAESPVKPSDLSPMEFLRRLDGLIDESKQAAVVGQQEAERRSVLDHQVICPCFHVSLHLLVFNLHCELVTVW